METDMDDTDIVRRIGELTDEEHRLQRAHSGEPLVGEKLARLIPYGGSGVKSSR